jgi:signal transduction histidine kinase
MENPPEEDIGCLNIPRRSIMTIKQPFGDETLKTDLLGRFSHEIRTPLTSIIGYAEVMLNDPKLPPEAKQEYVEIIRNAGKRLSEFLDTYIESEVVERNRLLNGARHEDVSLLVQRAISMIASQAQDKSLNVICNCEPAIFIEGVSTDHVVHILENLLDNAIDLACEHGLVEVNVVQHPSVIAIEVVNKDRGCLSVSVNSASRNFRWIQSPGIEIHHDGLGLAFAKHVVELEGGLLNVQALDQGLTFTLQFPRPGHN